MRKRLKQGKQLCRRSAAALLLCFFICLIASCNLYRADYSNPFDPESPVSAIHTPPGIFNPATGFEFSTSFDLTWQKAGTIADTYRLQVAAEQDFREGSVVLDIELTDVESHTVGSVPFHGSVYCRLALKIEQQGQTWSPWSTPLRLVKTVPAGNQAPTVSMETSGPVAAVGGQTVSIDASGADPDGDAVVYRWYVNGVRQNCRSADFAFIVPSSTKERSHTVEVETWDGALASDRVEITVEAEAGGGGGFTQESGVYAIATVDTGLPVSTSIVASNVWSMTGSMYEYSVLDSMPSGVTIDIISGPYTYYYLIWTWSGLSGSRIFEVEIDAVLKDGNPLKLVGGGHFYSGSSSMSGSVDDNPGYPNDGKTVRREISANLSSPVLSIVLVFVEGTDPVYTVYYNANGASSGTVPAQSDTVAGTSQPVPDSGNLYGPLVTDGITQRFTGWNTQPDGSGTTYQPDETLTMPASNLTLYAQWSEDGGVIGKVGPAGGIVFYENSNHTVDGWRYLESWTADEPDYYQWKTSDTETPGTSTDIGSGYANTYTAMTGPEHPAAEAARNVSHGGYTDWFLPSQDELNLMYEQMGVIGGFASDIYWCSSEYNYYTVWSETFDYGYQWNYPKNHSLRVRVVRAFPI